MGKIRLLSENLVNLISAGEVIERPASVVKELVENSLDAGAKRVFVETLGGGQDLIRVVDDGSGISREDLAVAIKRHATSKISSEEELWKIATLGFRGEALASICEVAKVEVASNVSESESGHVLRVSGGKTISLEPAGLPKGTRVCVQELFFNTPARAKYLKKQTGENRVIIKTLQDLALANPQVNFELSVEGQQRLRTPGDGDYQSAVAAIFGSTYASKVRTISYSNNFGSVEGWVGAIGHYASSRNDQVFAVNGRVFKHQPFIYVVESAFRGSLPVRRFPVFTLNISVEPDTVDVNVHPTKQEIKFQYEEELRRLIYAAVKDALTSRVAQKERKLDKPQVSFEEPAQYVLPTTMLVKSVARPVERLEINTQRNEDEVAESQEFRYLGQVYQTYLVWELEGALAIMDQHAAHERILFEQIIEAFRKKGHLDQQELLFPQTIDFSPGEWERIWEAKDALADFGFAIEDFGSNSALVRGVPLALAGAGIGGGYKETLLELAAALDEGQAAGNKEQVDAFYWPAAQLAACKGAIKAGERLDAYQASKLISDWLKLGISTCPHGRPIVRSFSAEALAKLFLRS